MEKIEQRSYIKGRVALGLNAVQIQAELIQIHHEDAFQYSTIAKWVARFKAGRTNLNDDVWIGGPITAVTQANIQLVESLVKENRHITYDEIKACVSLSNGSITKILKDELKLKKYSSRWIPHHLTPQNMLKRLEFSKLMLDKLDSGEWRLDQIITGDESWFYHRQIKKKVSNCSWRTADEPPETHVRRGRFEKKTMFSVFFRSSGLVHVTYVDKGETIDSKYYI